jgi:glycogen debranching enzyme
MRWAKIAIEEHLLNPNEFWSEWVLPSIARDDSAFKDQNYWRGRIWGPMNYLVYPGLRNYDVPQVRRQLAQKSLKLIQQEWHEKGHLHENYSAITGEGDDVTNSDAFYHWGALFGLIEWTEENSPVRAGLTG